MIEETDALEEGYDTEELVKIFSAASEIEGFCDLLRKMIYRDMVLHVNTPKENSDMIRGAIIRTKYLLKLVQTKGDPRKLRQVLDKKE